MKTVTIVAAALLTAGAASAATITPVSAVGSSSFPTYDDFYAIDTGSGSDVTDWSSFGEGAGATLNLDLGAVYTLATAFVTDRVTSGGPNFAYFGGTTDFTTSFSLTAYTDATFTTVIGAPVVFNVATPTSPTGPSSFLSTVALGGLTAQYIQYTVLGANGGNTGLSNINFATVPEPATWGLMLAGFGLVGFAARRRRTAVTA